MKIPRYIDSHAHLFYADYAEDFKEVLMRANEAGVEYIIIPGTDLTTSQEAVHLAEKHRCVFACVGIHPHETAKATDGDVQSIEELSMHPKVVAIGEIGLDYYYAYSPRERQRAVFASQLEVAVRRDLPVVIHTRESTQNAFSIVHRIISQYPHWRTGTAFPQRGVFHCFPGTVEEALQVFQLGFCVSFPGIVTFKKSEGLEVIKRIGIENILLETDSPYMSPVPLRGKRNEPANIIYIGRKISEALNITEEIVAQRTTETAIRLFNLED
jgi:TatD DNase family protein